MSTTIIDPRTMHAPSSLETKQALRRMHLLFMDETANAQMDMAPKPSKPVRRRFITSLLRKIFG